MIQTSKYVIVTKILNHTKVCIRLLYFLVQLPILLTITLVFVLYSLREMTFWEELYHKSIRGEGIRCGGSGVGKQGCARSPSQFSSGKTVSNVVN